MSEKIELLCEAHRVIECLRTEGNELSSDELTKSGIDKTKFI